MLMWLAVWHSWKGGAGGKTEVEIGVDFEE